MEARCLTPSAKLVNLHLQSNTAGSVLFLGKGRTRGLPTKDECDR